MSVSGAARAAWRVCLAVMAGLAVVSCGPARPVQAIRVGVPPLEQNSLLYVASAKGFFASQGIAVTVVDFENGPAALAAVERGDVDVAETAELPFVLEVMAGRPLRIVAVNDRFENDYLVVRKEHGITRPSDLRGARVGVSRGTIAEFYLQRFLTLNGLRGNDVTLLDVRPSDFVSAIQGGSLDAIAAWQPFVSRMTAADPRGLAVWPVQAGQAVYGLLVCSSPWLGAHPRELTAFLKALARAEGFITRDAAAARSIVAARLHYDDAYLLSVWPLHDYSLTLDFSLVTALEEEARWAASTGRAKGPFGTDFMTLLYRDGLAAARPEGVNLMQ